MAAPETGQLPLAVGLADEATFGNFVPSPENLPLLAWLRDPKNSDSPLLIWGPPASGRTHLLQACCHQAQGGGAFFLPLRQKDRLAPEILEGLDGLATICIDDIQCVAGIPEWEIALVRLIDKVNATASRLLLSASANVADLPWEMPDLPSRLRQALVFKLHPLNDAGILQAFELRARKRGLRLAAGVADFIGVRAERRLDALMEILQRLDESSMQRQRPITIPLIKEILHW